jgi:hypothetical protein
MGHNEGRRAFGVLLRRYREHKNVSQAWVASMLSHPPHGDIWTGNNVGRLERGERKITPALADQLITMLDMDEDEAYEALGWWPKGVTRRDITDLRRGRAGSERRSRRDEGDVPAAVEVPV